MPDTKPRTLNVQISYFYKVNETYNQIMMHIIFTLNWCRYCQRTHWISANRCVQNHSQFTWVIRVKFYLQKEDGSCKITDNTITLFKLPWFIVFTDMFCICFLYKYHLMQTNCRYFIGKHLGIINFVIYYFNKPLISSLYKFHI